MLAQQSGKGNKWGPQTIHHLLGKQAFSFQRRSKGCTDSCPTQALDKANGQVHLSKVKANLHSHVWPLASCLAEKDCAMWGMPLVQTRVLPSATFVDQWTCPSTVFARGNYGKVEDKWNTLLHPSHTLGDAFPLSFHLHLLNHKQTSDLPNPVPFT